MYGLAITSIEQEGKILEALKGHALMVLREHGGSDNAAKFSTNVEIEILDKGGEA
jgi:hypothetical protein